MPIIIFILFYSCHYDIIATTIITIWQTIIVIIQFNYKSAYLLIEVHIAETTMSLRKVNNDIFLYKSLILWIAISLFYRVNNNVEPIIIVIIGGSS